MLSTALLDAIIYKDVKHITSKEYFSEDEYAHSMFDTKYCTKWDEKGCVVIDSKKPYTTIETPADVFWRISSGLAEMEETEKNKDLYARHWFSLMWLGWFRPGGSVMAGVGASSLKSLLNCTTLPLSEDSIEGINKLDYDIMKCAAFRQGLGFDGSVLRPRGALVNNAAEESTGSVPWICKLVDNGKWVGQKGRKPAILVSLKDHHPDIYEFVRSKAEKGILEDANISVQISNKFIEAVKAGADWELYFDFGKGSRYERISRMTKAKELFDLIAEMAFKHAEPGVQYIDLLREGSMVHQVYLDTNDERFKIISTNACSEKALPKFGVCNLLSPNHAMFSTDPEEYKAELDFIVPYMVRMSDNVTTYELFNRLSPLKEQAWVLEQTREIGMGITNIHGWLLKQDIAYDADEAIVVVEEFFKRYACNVFKASMVLGEEKGSAPAFALVKDKGAFMGSSYFKNIITEIFGGDYTKVIYLRNMAHMSVAPTGSLSNTFPIPCFSYGVEPFTGYHWRRTRAIDKGKYTHYFILPDKMKQYVLSKLPPESADYKTLQAFSGSALDDDGEIGLELAAIVDRTIPKGFFKPAHFIDPLQKIKLMGAMYKWVDAAISCTYNLPPTATVKDVENIYMEAYNHGVRAVAVYVEGSREGILIYDDPKTNEARHVKKEVYTNLEDRPKTIIPCSQAPVRPKELPCNIVFTNIKGETWVVLVGLLDGKIFEIFSGSSEDLYLPKICKEGIIRKQGKGKYELEVMIRKSPVVYKDLASILMTDGQKAVTRLLSLSLRHGVPSKFIVEQLKKANGSISDFSTAVARVLSKYVDTYELEGEENKCPKCGENSLMFVEGCISCACGYSRCG